MHFEIHWFPENFGFFHFKILIIRKLRTEYFYDILLRSSMVFTAYEIDNTCIERVKSLKDGFERSININTNKYHTTTYYKIVL